ncbi:MAG: GGDEF domain-containing protein [Candidatus Gastranaerophilales bacterium]|nr:GGDEF domain-containing protein [Candidatus Gastranaerophilales bacterium]
MSNLIIYTETNNPELETLCRKVSDLEVIVKSADDLQDMSNEDAAAAIIDISSDKLKEISMIMKFPLPVLVIADDFPSNIKVRGEAYDFIINPVSEYELSVRLKNLIKIKELKEKIENISTTDDLTGLHNRKFLLERLESEMSRAKRYNSTVSCILFDIDFFKVVNDMYGYEWGDVLLKKIAEMLLNLARKEDVVTRYGDEEFMVILPDTSEENAFIFAERFRRDVEKMSFIPAGEDERHPIKISGGIAAYPFMDNVEENANSVIRYAEHALYNAKKRGKNRIVLFSQVNLDY